jgi:hypothetical protein
MVLPPRAYEAKGDFEKAKTLIKERGLAKAKEKSDREANEGVVECRIGKPAVPALIEAGTEAASIEAGPKPYVRTDGGPFGIETRAAKQTCVAPPKYDQPAMTLSATSGE